MRIVRGLGGALLWIVASLLGLVGVLLCVTIVLLPLGIAVLRVSRRMWTSSVRLMLPRAVAHPVKEAGRRGRRKREAVADEVTSRAARAREKVTGKRTLRQKVGQKVGRKLRIA